MEPPAQYRILAIDRHPEHVEVIRRTLEKGDIVSEVVAIADPDDALAYLNRQGSYDQSPRPDLILLDLNSSHAGNTQTGLSILEALKTSPELKHIPIIILTLADDTDLIYDSYTLQGNCYVLKSSNLDQLTHIVQRIEEFWLGIVTLPIQ
ncbi:MAG: response regulator [Cyanobacteria bacterium P01_F01_bin.150]